MLFIILIVFLWVFQVVGSGLLIYFRKEPSIKLRELTLSLLYTFILTLHCTFTGVVLERFYVGETWKGYCSMLSWSLVLSTPGIIWPLLFKAHSFQFQFYKFRTKITEEDSSYFLKYRWTIQLKSTLGFTIICFIISIIPAIVVHYTVPVDLDSITAVSECLGPNVYVYLFQGAAPSLFTAYLVYKYHEVYDPFWITREFLILIFSVLPIISVFVITQIVENATSTTTFPSLYQPALMNYIASYCMAILANWIPLITLFYSKQRNKITRLKTDENFGIKMIFESTVLTHAFLRIALDNWCLESFLFAIAVEKYTNAPNHQLLAQSQEIWRKFIQRGTELQVSISHSEYESIRRNILEGKVDHELFSKAIVDVLAQLEEVLVKWRRQRSYKKVITEYQEEYQKESVNKLELKQLS